MRNCITSRCEDTNMFTEFNFDLPDSSHEPIQETHSSPEQDARVEELLKRRVMPEESGRLERLLLQRLKEKKADLDRMLGEMSARNYEDHFYRYYHCSFKVYGTQNTTERAVNLLRELIPGRKLNMSFEDIIRKGIGKEFQMEHNRNWEDHTRPMLEAFAHAKFMIEMAVRYTALTEPPQPMPSGYAALLYLYDLR
jgi:hypothetical protein